MFFFVNNFLIINKNAKFCFEFFIIFIIIKYNLNDKMF